MLFWATLVFFAGVTIGVVAAGAMGGRSSRQPTVVVMEQPRSGFLEEAGCLTILFLLIILFSFVVTLLISGS